MVHRCDGRGGGGVFKPGKRFWEINRGARRFAVHRGGTEFMLHTRYNTTVCCVLTRKRTGKNNKYRKKGGRGGNN